ncbi:MAG TPA: alkaline phosphatase family protein [Polyangia bacterium]|nr:alkaline phosphatase family protein [Polyangia bacterium]
MRLSGALAIRIGLGLGLITLGLGVVGCGSSSTNTPRDATGSSGKDGGGAAGADASAAGKDGGVDATAGAGGSGGGGAGGKDAAAGTDGGAAGTDAAAGGDGAADATDGGTDAVATGPRKKVIIFVWDGLRPDSVTAQITPNLARLRDTLGTNFTDNHAVFPTLTMTNAPAFATGSYPATHGFYGDTEYQPGPAGKDATGAANDFAQPIFTEDYGVLQALDAYDVAQNQGALLLVSTLFQQAHAAGLKTAAVGMSGAAFIQDYREDGTGGVIFDEDIAFPETFARNLQGAGFPLPANAKLYPFADGPLALDSGNGDPTATNVAAVIKLADATTPDPRALAGSPHNAKNEYMMGVYLSYILPRIDPDLTLIWLRNPDSTEHTFGPGSAPALDSLRDQDLLLGRLQTSLATLGLAATTDLIVVSDHGHATVAGDPAFFPLRGLTGAPDGSGAVGPADPHGYSVSGDIRSADLLTKAGVPHVYDGVGCTYDPVMSGIKADGTQLYPTQIDVDGTICGGAANAKYTTVSFKVPATVPTDAVIIAANGGSDYLYVPSHDVNIVKQVVTALQTRKGYGAIFVRSTYGALAGTMSLKDIDVEGATRGSPPTPDIIVSFDWNETATTAGGGALPGTEYESAQGNRGTHGTFGPVDVHNTLIAAGPDFRPAFKDTYPTGNVDVAPTAAKILGVSLPQATGRVLKEAMPGNNVTYTVTPGTAMPAAPATIAGSCNPDDPTCAAPTTDTSYNFVLSTKTLTLDDNTTKYVYFDKAKATRQ